MFKPPHPLFLLIVLGFGSLYLLNGTALAQSDPVGSAEREQGIALYRQGLADKAVAALNTAVKKNKTDPQAWYYLGLAQIQINEFSDANKSLIKTVQLQPDFAPAHLALAFVGLNRGKHVEAARYAEQVLILEPNSTEAHYLLGVARLREDKKEEALKQSEATIELNPKFAAAYLLKSQALVSFLSRAPIWDRGEPSEERKARFHEAATAIKRFLELDPDAEDKQTWLDQLASLEFHSSSHEGNDGTERVYSGKEVTTKARVTNKPEPFYTDAARQRGTEGRVVLRCMFAGDGTVKHLLIVEALPNGMTERALEAARQIKFIPATLDGKPVSMFIQLEYNFRLY
jgi:TonB family protein